MASCSTPHSSIFVQAASTSSASIGPALGPAGRACSRSSSSAGVSLTRTAVAAAAAAGSPFSSGAPLKFGRVKTRIASPFWWGFVGADRSNSSPAVRLCPCLRAKRKSRGGNVSQEEDAAEEELDEDLRVGLNEISTEALKAMLSEDDRIVAALREKVEYLGEYLSQEEHLDAARFMRVVMGMLDHEVITEKDDLTGAYKKAFDKLASVIEDSGWVLKQAGADVGGVEMVDDELMPPVLNTQY